MIGVGVYFQKPMKRALVTDSFERQEVINNANITDGAGASGSLITTQTGEAWRQYLGTWARDSNGIFISTILEGWNIAYVNSGVSDCVMECDLKWNGGSAGFMFRMTPDEDNFFVCYIMDWYMELGKVENWSMVTLDEDGIDLVQGQTYSLKLILDGDNIEFYVNDVLRMSATSTFNQNATRHGLCSNNVNVTNRLSNLTISGTSTSIDILGEYWYREYQQNPWSAQISTNYAKTGSRSLRMELRRTDEIVNGSKRSEVAINTPETPLEEHIYCFSIYLPNGGDEDYALDPEGSEIVAQWHNVPDSGEGYTMPPLALRTIGGNWRIDRAWDANEISDSEDIVANNQIEHIDIGSYLGDKGKWTDWKFHVKWGWLPQHNTILEVYKNGVLVLNRNGQPNTTNDQVGVYMKLGIYKWDWAQDPDIYSTIDTRVIYYDAVKIL